MRYRGRLVRSTGDGMLATFDGPARAVRSALAIRNGAQAIALELRAGVHTSECEVMANDLAGIAVHLTARIQAAAEPGEVLTSARSRIWSSGPDSNSRPAGHAH
jgi:class 3 adenylate cyclase